jgi:hypothetical protein
MGLRFFQIPARGCATAESELNSFLSSHRVLTIDRRWVDLGECSQGSEIGRSQVR